MENLNSKNLSLQEKVEMQKKKIRNLKKNREEIFEKLIQFNQNGKNDYHLKIENEINEIKLKTKSDFDQILKNTKHFFERENFQLKESRDRAFLEIDKLKLKLEEKEKIYVELLDE
jgi:hypothetical protein